MFQVRLKELRERAGFSQAVLAKKVGVAQSTVGMWESGRNKPENSKLEALATLFNVSTDYLLGRDEPTQTIDEQLSEIDFALSGEIRDLNDDEKQDVLDFVRFKRAQRKE